MDPFVVLGVPRTATKDEIKRAFRKRAMECHPDQHASSPESVRKGAEASFKALNDAYQLLMDDSRRYSQSRTTGQSQHGSPFARGSWGSASTSSGGGTYYHDPGSRGAYAHQYARRQSGLDFRGTFRAFTAGFTRAEALYTLALGGVMLVAGVVLEPAVAVLWESRNEGKLYKDIEGQRLQQQAAQLQLLREARRLREQAAAAAAAPRTAQQYSATSQQQLVRLEEGRQQASVPDAQVAQNNGRPPQASIEKRQQPQAQEQPQASEQPQPQ